MIIGRLFRDKFGGIEHNCILFVCIRELAVCYFKPRTNSSSEMSSA